MERLGRDDVGRLRQRGIVDRHVAEAEQRQPFGLRRFGDDLFDMGAQRRVLRHEPVADAILAGRRQFDALRRHLLAEEPVGNLHQHAGAIAHQRVGADGAAMRQVFEHGKAVLDDLVRLHALHVDDEADAAGVMLVARIVEALGGQAGSASGSAMSVRTVFLTAAAFVCAAWPFVAEASCPSSSCPPFQPFRRWFASASAWLALILAARLAKSLPNHAACRMVRIRYRTGQRLAVHLSLAATAGVANMIRQSSLFCATK